MMAFTRLVVRAFLAIVVFALVCPLLVAISLVAMYSDRRVFEH